MTFDPLTYGRGLVRRGRRALRGDRDLRSCAGRRAGWSGSARAWSRSSSRSRCSPAGALCAVVAVGLQGYRALTREDLAATVHTTPIGPQSFEARIVLPDGSEANYRLAGDQFAVEARILKWHPWANLLGLHTAYELDRVTGRYADLEDERSGPRTVFPLSPEHRVDLFAWRARLPWLAPLVDAEYGSSTFTRADRAASYEVRVSTTGLLVREVP
jgi:hypothetical protein